MAKRGCKRVSRKKARFASGKKKGKLKPGCRYLKGDGAQCCPPGSTKKGRKTGRKKRKRRATGAARRARKGVAPRTPKMDRLNQWRRAWKSGTCGQKRAALQQIKKQFQHMAYKDPKPKRGESVGQARQRRWKRWQSEYNNKLRMTASQCTGRPARSFRPVGPAMVSGIGGHPCGSASPPAWCRK
jgi:hypothetical protein